MAELKRLRSEAGNPSFRKMAELSGAVSHATLHLTVTGRRLQPWETVREFVRACGGDEAEWCSRYRRTKALLSGALPEPADSAGRADGATAGDETAGADEDATTAESATTAKAAKAAESAECTDGVGGYGAGEVSAGDAAGSSPARGGFSRRWLLVPSAVLAIVAVVIGLRVFDGEERQAEAGGQQASGGASGSAEAGGLTEAMYPGDDSALSRDLGIQDGDVVAPGQQFTRTFELLNAGSVHWKDRYLERMENATGPRYCETPVRVEIPDTAPGETVRVPVTARAADEPTTCKVRWKMVDDEGRQLLPQKRPVYFLVHVRTGPSEAPSR
nr:NBR1-Ig-like domain-containing protein [Prauserella isguenensis]